jgi:anti-sigma B factor antagonist
MMKSSVRDVGDVRVIGLEGKVTIGAGDIQLRGLIDQAIEAGRSKVLLDLAEVTHVDSSGIGEMVGCFTTLTRRGGAMKLVNLPDKINDILQVTQLITVFDVFANETEALASF